MQPRLRDGAPLVDLRGLQLLLELVGVLPRRRRETVRAAPRLIDWKRVEPEPAQMPAHPVTQWRYVAAMWTTFRHDGTLQRITLHKTKRRREEPLTPSSLQ